MNRNLPLVSNPTIACFALKPRNGFAKSSSNEKRCELRAFGRMGNRPIQLATSLKVRQVDSLHLHAVEVVNVCVVVPVIWDLGDISWARVGCGVVGVGVVTVEGIEVRWCCEDGITDLLSENSAVFEVGVRNISMGWDGAAVMGILLSLKSKIQRNDLYDRDLMELRVKRVLHEIAHFVDEESYLRYIRRKNRHGYNPETPRSPIQRAALNIATELDIYFRNDIQIVYEFTYAAGVMHHGVLLLVKDSNNPAYEEETIREQKKLKNDDARQLEYESSAGSNDGIQSDAGSNGVLWVAQDSRGKDDSMKELVIDARTGDVRSGGTPEARPSGGIKQMSGVEAAKAGDMG
ncbi:hypothetical protein EDB89DRAFT_1913168 [Lactarius sanguifluus]|nr:hypothetical protein EDB89DRAFT_1913168 [Lactarius sanguifluus]